MARRAGTTVIDLLIGVGLLVLLFGGVVLTLSQGFTAFRLSQTQVTAQEASRVALEQTAAFVRAASQPPTVTVTAPSGDDEDRDELVVTRRRPTGGLDTLAVRREGTRLRLTGAEERTAGHSVRKNRFRTGSDGPDGRPVTLELATVVGTRRQELRSVASPRASRLVTSPLGITTNKASLPNRASSADPAASQAQITVTVGTTGVTNLRVIRPDGSLVAAFPSVVASQSYGFDATGLSAGAYTFLAEGTWESALRGTIPVRTPTSVTVTVADPCAGAPPSCPTGQRLEAQAPYGCSACVNNPLPPQLSRALLVESDGIDPFGEVALIDAALGTHFNAATDRSSPMIGYYAAIYDESGNLLTLIYFPWWSDFYAAGNPQVTWTGPTSIYLGGMDHYTGYSGYDLYDDPSARTLTIGGTSYDLVGWASATPVILDLTGIGIPDVPNGDWLPHPTRFDRYRAKIFDLTGEGFTIVTEWVGPNSGLLCTLDKHGTVSSAKQLFGSADGWPDGYMKLAALFDKDHNGVVEGEELDGLYVWHDQNQDAKADPGELKPVQAYGITKIWTGHDHFRSIYERNGKRYYTWDWWATAVVIRKQDRNELLKGRDIRQLIIRPAGIR